MDPLQQAAFSQRILVLGMMSLVPLVIILHLVDSIRRRRRAFQTGMQKEEPFPRKMFQLYLGIAFLTMVGIAVGCVLYLSFSA
jgi:hypothetical protein